MKSGFVAMATVLVISAVSIATIGTVMLLAIGELQSSSAAELSQQSLRLVEGCAEDALLKIGANSAWAGGALSRPEGNCNVTINSGNPNWNITVATVGGDYQRWVQVIFTRAASLAISSWEEI